MASGRSKMASGQLLFSYKNKRFFNKNAPTLPSRPFAPPGTEFPLNYNRISIELPQNFP
jgi:hypothetical protein